MSHDSNSTKTVDENATWVRFRSWNPSKNQQSHNISYAIYITSSISNMIITGSILVDRNLSPTFPRFLQFLQLATILGNFLAGLRYRFLHPWGAGEQNPSLSTRGSALGPGDADRRQPPHVRPAAAVGEAEALWQHQRRARPPRLCPRLCGGESRLLKGTAARLTLHCHQSTAALPAGWLANPCLFFSHDVVLLCVVHHFPLSSFLPH